MGWDRELLVADNATNEPNGNVAEVFRSDFVGTAITAGDLLEIRTPFTDLEAEVLWDCDNAVTVSLIDGNGTRLIDQSTTPATEGITPRVPWTLSPDSVAGGGSRVMSPLRWQTGEYRFFLRFDGAAGAVSGHITIRRGS